MHELFQFMKNFKELIVFKPFMQMLATATLAVNQNWKISVIIQLF